MSLRRSNARARSVAILATLHVGIEPALLALLAGTGAMPIAAGGWVVGAGQVGMSAGALLCWRSAMAARRPASLAAALVGTGAALGLVIVHSLAGVLLLRLVLGGVMGLLLARATAVAARAHAHRAIGVIMLGQQLLAMAVMVVLPVVAAHWHPGAALALLAAVPLVASLLVAFEGARPAPSASPMARERFEGDALRLEPANLAGMALLIAVTLMIWSYMGAIGTSVGAETHVAGIAIAIASLASAPAALLALLTRPRHEPWTIALLCGLAALTPLLLPQGSGLAGYVAAMILFNAGSTFGVIRFSAWAMEGCAGERGRRLVVLVQCVAMAGGAPLGAVAMSLGGLLALAMLAALCTVGAVLTPLIARYAPTGMTLPPRLRVAR